ncbi:MAG TPA: hypothetical protein VF062_00425 [Candidatus Limnocylindrales bacterium]
MPDSGKELGAGLHELWKVAQNFERVQDEFYAARNAVADTVLKQDKAFRWDHRDGYGPVYRVWSELRAEIVSILGDTDQSLGLTADALRQAVRAYARADDEAAAELDRRQQWHRGSDDPGRFA